MENKENKIKAVKLSDGELENVSGGLIAVVDGPVNCYKCGKEYDVFELYLINNRHYCAACKELLGL